MGDNKNELYITLYGDGDEELLYRVEHIFDVEGETLKYCSVVPENGGDVIFLRCEIVENDTETEIYVADIPYTEEYIRVSETYAMNIIKATNQTAIDELSDYEDFITVTDVDGLIRNFIIHSIFDDEKSGRSYVAVQEIKENGLILEEISLYRFIEDGETVQLDMIASDMEYENARNLFMKLIE